MTLITLPLTVRVALGRDEAEVLVFAMLFGVVIAMAGAALAEGGLA